MVRQITERIIVNALHVRTWYANRVNNRINPDKDVMMWDAISARYESCGLAHGGSGTW